jgi:dipeptidyl aminopeptidase/acylaminoacyl peptidase
MSETQREPRPFGLWDSPISARSLAEDKRLDAVRYAGGGETLVWLEGRSGQGVLVAQAPGDAPRDLTSDLSVRAEVGYGGGDFAVQGEMVVFAVHKTGQLYRQQLAAGTALPITPSFGKASAPAISPDGKWVVYVHHHNDIDCLAIVAADGKSWPQILTAGHDFYMQPRWSPDGKQLAWIAWDHPNMPWDGTTLYLAEMIGGASSQQLGAVRAIAGGKDISVFQPEFTPDGRGIVYVADALGWGQLHFQPIDANGVKGVARTLTTLGVEYAMPAWLQDMRRYAIGHDGKYLVAAANRNGVLALERIDLAYGRTTPIQTGTIEAGGMRYQDFVQVVASPTQPRCAAIASGPQQPARVIEIDMPSVTTRVVARSATETVPPASLSACESVSWKSAGGAVAHGLFYAPATNRFAATGKPPLIVLVHGGPTSQVTAGWRADGQFFATRGYAVLYVNYRGSTGFGREYMLALRENWGVCDVQDSISGARYIAETGRCDPARTVIMGGSAGGFTVLQAMVEQPEAFAAGVCLYGVSDQFAMAAETHKFEARYMDTLLGPLPEAAAVYRARSPGFHADKIRRPLAVFQGAIDNVVPKNQSDVIVDALRRTGTPHIYHVYEGEGHGWRKRETIEHFYQAVESFLRTYVIFR